MTTAEKTTAHPPGTTVNHDAVRQVTECTQTCQILASLRDRLDGQDQVAAALVKVQAKMPKVAKNQTANIPGKNGGQGYSYRYADLADVADAIMPLITAEGLSFVTMPRRTADGGYEVAGRLVHTSGQYLEASLPLIGRSAQEHGSSLTYNRRYLLGCLTGIITDDDDDGSIAQAAQAARANVDRGPAAKAVWAKANEKMDLESVQQQWRVASRDGLLGVAIEHMDGAEEPLGDALKRLGDALAGKGDQPGGGS